MTTAALAAQLRLYLATDRAFLRGRDWTEVVRAAVAGGVTAVQLRDKQASARELYELAVQLRPLTRRLGVPLIVNDRLDVALAADADGVHLGQTDLPVAAARRLAPGRIIGCSAATPAALEQAAADGADYAGLGAAFATSTKADAPPVLGPAGVTRLVRATRLPCVAIGGISAANLATLTGTGLAGVCVISAILGAPDPHIAAAELRRLADRLFGGTP